MGRNNLPEGKIPASDYSNNAMKQTEDMLSNELNKLSLQETCKAYDDVHCVGNELKETPEMIQTLLLEFDQAISKHRNSVLWMHQK